MEDVVGKISNYNSLLQKKHLFLYKCLQGALLSFCLMLSGCLVPDKYNAILEVSNSAYFLEFIGEMRIMVLYSDDYKNGSLSLAPNAKPLHEQVVSEFERVIKERNNARIETRQNEPTVFQTSFAYNSNYNYPEASGLFNFSVNGNILTIESRKISVEDREILQRHNIPSSGMLCIKTTGQVLESNAQKNATAINRCNTWNMKNLDEGIKMVIKFREPIVLQKKS